MKIQFRSSWLKFDTSITHGLNALFAAGVYTWCWEL